MRIYDLTDDEGRVFAFEVDNAFLSRGAACGVARGIPSARLIREPRMFSGEDEFCEFELEGVAFVLGEPWGDSSRYWIGPREERRVPQIDRVREAFAGWRPWGLFGDGLRWMRRLLVIPKSVRRTKRRILESAGVMLCAAWIILSGMRLRTFGVQSFCRRLFPGKSAS